MKSFKQKILKTTALCLFTLLPLASYASRPNSFYVGGFGAWGHSGNNSTTQSGTAYFPASSGGPMDVRATGNLGASAWLAGLHLGYQWQEWSDKPLLCHLAPAVELEGFFLRTNQNGELDNPTARLPEHTFDVTLPMYNKVFLANAVFHIKTSSDRITPYVGIGAGGAYVSVQGATSAQESPAEPGVNHFNSDPDGNDLTLAAQGKLGLGINFMDNWRFFAEYRCLFLNSTNYTFGSTQYPTHVETTNWNVSVGDMIFNTGAVGLEYDFG